MVNIQGGTRMSINRYIELLRARIKSAPTRYIGDRRQRLSSTRCQYLDQAVKERQKADIYNKKKRRSMWEQNVSFARRFSEPKDRKHMDRNQYRPKEPEQRMYSCTWTDFPENVMERQCKPFTPPSVEEAPHRRRSPGDRPNTAKPFDEGAVAFINEWENKNAIMNRNKYVLLAGSCPPPVVNQNVDRRQRFHY
ncbi:hypothetical protein KR054_004405 [Drosophila jambulina]|nr:hypothetical protein KR054_004405 [Drosophila jambulina]